MKTMSKLLKGILYFVLPVSLIFVFVVSFVAVSKLVFPSERMLENGDKLSVVAKEQRKELLKDKDIKPVSFRTKDGLKLSAYFIKKSNPRANVLLCHGYMSCKERINYYLKMFPDDNILMFDFRANGQSEGRYRTMGCHEYKDVIAAVDYFKEQTKQNDLSPKLPMIILGVSMGGASTIKAMGLEPNLCDALIVESSFAKLSDVIQNAFTTISGLPYFPFVPVAKMITNYLADCDVDKMSPIDSLKNIDKPIFFIHSCVDNIVDPKDSLLMYSKCLNEKKKLWITGPCNHGKVGREFFDSYKVKVEKFLKQALA